MNLSLLLLAMVWQLDARLVHHGLVELNPFGQCFMGERPRTILLNDLHQRFQGVPLHQQTRKFARRITNRMFRRFATSCSSTSIYAYLGLKVMYGLLVSIGPLRMSNLRPYPNSAGPIGREL